METAITVAIAYVVWNILMPLALLILTIAGIFILISLLERTEKKRKAGGGK